MANPVTKATSSRPDKRTKRTSSVEKKVLEAIAEGELVGVALKKAKVGRTTWHEWVKEDPELGKKYEAACRAGLEVQEEEALGICMRFAKDGAVTKVKRVFVKSKDEDPNANEESTEDMDDEGEEEENDKVIITKETTRNPMALVKLLAMRQARRRLDLEPGGGGDILTILNEAHQGVNDK